MSEVRDTPLFAVLESTGLFVKVETIDGSTYTGKLTRLEIENGDMELIDVKCQHRDSSLSVECRIFIKGSSIRLVHLPADMKKAAFLDWSNPKIQKELKNSLKARKSKLKERPKINKEKVKKDKRKIFKKMK